MSELRYYDLRDVAAMFGLTYRAAQQRANRHGWPHFRIGRQMFFTDADLAAIERMGRRVGVSGGTPAPTVGIVKGRRRRVC